MKNILNAVKWAIAAPFYVVAMSLFVVGVIFYVANLVISNLDKINDINSVIKENIVSNFKGK